jgi:photosystem II stability/assembly factor-like uncharacterized protein
MLQNSLIYSTDNGDSWNPIDNPAADEYVRYIAIDSNGYFYAGTHSGRVHISTNTGTSWSPYTPEPVGPRVYTLTIDPQNNVVAGTQHAGLFRYNRDVDAWIKIDKGIPASVTNPIFVTPDDRLIAGINATVFYSFDESTSNWQPLRLPSIFHGVSPTLNFPKADEWYASLGTLLFRSTDYGVNWDSLGGMPDNSGVGEVHRDSVGALLVFTGQTLFRSTDEGASWQDIATTQNAPTLRIGTDGTYYLASNLFGLQKYSIMTSIDNGASWQQLGTEQMYGNAVSMVLLDNDRVIVATNAGQIHRWMRKDDLWISDSVSLHGPRVYSLAAAPDKPMIAGTSTGVIRSTDQGITWTSFSDGLPTPQSHSDYFSIAIDSRGRGYVNTEFGGVFQSSDVLSRRDFTHRSQRIATTVSPNPTSGVAMLAFILETPSHAVITLHAPDGSRIGTLGDAQYPAGENMVRWDASQLPSGVYLYRIRTTTAVEEGSVVIVE